MTRANAGTVPALLENSFRAHAQSEALRFRGADGSWTGITYAELDCRVERLTRGLMAAGIGPGDRVAIICDSRPEWTLCDLALARAGAVSVPLYQVSTAPECEYVVRHSGARMLIAETSEHLAIGGAIQRKNPELRDIVAIDPGLAGDRMTLAGLTAVASLLTTWKVYMRRSARKGLRLFTIMAEIFHACLGSSGTMLPSASSL